MSIRKLETFVIDCDFCDAVYADVVEVSAAHIEQFAVRDGWDASESNARFAQHKCSACLEAERDASYAHGRTAPDPEQEGHGEDYYHWLNRQRHKRQMSRDE